MTKLSNKFILFGAIAAAVVVVPGVLGPLGFQEAAAAPNQSNRGTQTAQDNVVNAQVGVQANANIPVRVQDNQVAICVIAEDCSQR